MKKQVDYKFNDKGELLLGNLCVRGGIYYARQRVDGRQPMLSLGLKLGDPPAKIHAALLAKLGDDDAWKKTKTKITFRQFWDTYYLDYVAGQHSPRMVKFDGQRVVKKHEDGRVDYRIERDMVFSLDKLGARPMEDITEDMLRDYVRLRRAATYSRGVTKRPYAANSLAREFRTLGGIFRTATRQGVIARNPWENVDVPTGYTPSVVTITKEEQAKIEEKMSPSMVRWLNFMLGTGLRCFEGDALQATDINLDERWIRVVRKSRKSQPKVQQVPILSDEVAAIIRTQLEREGTMWNKNYATYWKQLNRAARRAGIDKRIGVHTLRHTFATRYIQAGGHLLELSQILGHSTTAQAQKTYIHLNHSDLRNASKGLDLGITAPPPTVASPATVLPFTKKEDCG